MKNFKVKWLLLSFILSIASINSVWAYWFVPGDFSTWNRDDGSVLKNNPANDNKNEVIYYAVPAGTYEFKLAKGENGTTNWGHGNATNGSSSIITALCTNCSNGNNKVTVNKTCDLTFVITNETNWDFTVYATDPTYHIKYPFGGGSWTWYTLAADGNGTYSVKGNYSGSSSTTYNYRKRTSNNDSWKSDGSASDVTLVNSPSSTSDQCIFTFDPSTDKLTIRKCNTVTHNNYIYFDNTTTNWDDASIQFVMGFPHYSKTFAMSNITNTKLKCYKTGNDEDWTDVGYYAMIGGTEKFADGTWGSANLYNATHYSAPYTTPLNLEAGYNYVVGKASATNGTAITMTKKGNTASALNANQTIKFSISRDGGSTYAEQTSGVTPAQITVSAYKFVNGTYNSVSNTSNSSSISAGQTSTRSTSVPAAYTGATSLSCTSKRDGYTFIGWYTAASGGSSVSSPFYPTAATTKYARFKAHRYTIKFSANDAQYPGTASGSTTSISDVVYDQNQTLTSNGFAREGYTFAGWATSPTGDVVYSDGASVSNLTSEDGEEVTLYAKWTDNNKYYFKGGKSGSETDWSAAENWTKGAAPSSADHEVYIFAPVKISSGTIHVKSVDIITAGSYSPSVGSRVDASGSKLTIGAGAMLIVDGKIQNYDRSTSKSDSTRASTLHIESNASGNGALVWGEEDFTPGYAQVDFFTKSHGEKDQNSSTNQYIGTPFSNEQSILYQYYYSWLFKIKRTAGVLNWDLMSGDESMNEFEGYNLMTAYDAGTTYQMEGILVSNADVTLSTSSATGLPKLVYTSEDGSNPNNENVLANSWVAPIKIKNMNVSGVFTNIDASIYIFNAGSVNDAANKETLAGNYSTYSVGTAAATDVIPSMQSFSVYANAASPVLFLDYSEIVQKDASNSLIISNKAPQREAETSEEMNLLKVRIEGENGWADELKIYIREDFSADFENGWDAHKMYGYPEAPQLYAVTTDGNMAINCVPTADNNVLGFTPGSEDNEYTFSFTYDGDEEYYLKDTKLNIETLINTEATYTFTSEAEDSDMRFIIIKRAPAVATDAETVSGDRLAVSGVQKIMHNGQLYIIRDGEIYDATGTMVK